MPIRISAHLTVPKEVLNAQDVKNEIIHTLNSKTTPEVKRLFQRTIVGWQNPPRFDDTLLNSANLLGTRIFSAGPNSDQYALVNAGSPRHPIPSQPGYLRFQRGYTSSTRPRVLSSRAFVRSGPWVSGVMQVSHPGFEAREFDQEIGEQYSQTFHDDMEDAVNRGSHRP